MNQILITEKIYITPELKKKKSLYRLEFFISIFFVCLLFSYYIYAEYDKNKSEEVSQSILANTSLQEKEDNTVSNRNDGVLVAVLGDMSEEVQQTSTVNEDIKKDGYNQKVYQTKSGRKYTTVSVVNIPKLGINYAVITEAQGVISTEEAMEDLLKVSPCRYWGRDKDKGVHDANEVGNYCIVAHNYRNRKFFSKVPTLEDGDIIELTDLTGRTLKYAVYKKYIVSPDDVECTSQVTDGKKELTLITCTDDGKERWIIKATEVL